MRIIKKWKRSPLTAIAGGSPPRTSPSPPVLLHGPTSAPTKTKFIPCSHITFPAGLSFSVFLTLCRACLAIAFAWVLICSISNLFKDLNPLWVIAWFLSPICAMFVLVSDPEVPWQLTCEVLDTKCEVVTVAITNVFDLPRIAKVV